MNSIDAGQLARRERTVFSLPATIGSRDRRGFVVVVLFGNRSYFRSLHHHNHPVPLPSVRPNQSTQNSLLSSTTSSSSFLPLGAKDKLGQLAAFFVLRSFAKLWVVAKGRRGALRFGATGEQKCVAA